MQRIRFCLLILSFVLPGCSTLIDRAVMEPVIATSARIPFEDVPPKARDAFLKAHPENIPDSVEVWTYQNGARFYRFHSGSTYLQFNEAGERTVGGVI